MVAGRFAKSGASGAVFDGVVDGAGTNVRFVFILRGAFEEHGLARKEGVFIALNNDERVGVEHALPDFRAEVVLGVIEPFELARVIGANRRIRGAQGECVNEVAVFGQWLGIASEHKVANFGEGRVADGGNLDEREVAHLEIRIRAHRDDSIEEVRPVDAEAERAKASAGMAGDNAPNAFRRDWITGFDVLDDFVADIVGVVALRARVNVLAAAPMVVAVDDNDAHGLNFFGQFFRERLPDDFAFDKLFGGTAEAGQVINDRRGRVAGKLAGDTNQGPAFGRVVERVGMKVGAGELKDFGGGVGACDCNESAIYKGKEKKKPAH